jgi:hypothetical protein
MSPFLHDPRDVATELTMNRLQNHRYAKYVSSLSGRNTHLVADLHL